MKARYAWAAAIACAVAILAACAIWMRQNPRPAYYDEALYAIYALIDAWALKTYGLTGAYYAMLKVDPTPPAQRLLALPFTAVLSPSLIILRAVSLAGLFASCTIIAVAVKRVAGAVASAFAFVFTMALPILVLSCQMFHTEYAFLLAIALLLLALTARRPAVLFALSVSIGLLAKASYSFAAAPMLAVAFFLFPDRRRAMAIGSAVGLVVASAWWVPSWSVAIELIASATKFARHQHGHYVFELVRCNFGVPVFLAILLGYGRALRRLPAMTWICLAGALPSIALHAAAINHNPRIIAIPTALVAIGAAVAAAQIDVREQGIALSLAVIQIAIMVSPWAKSDQGSLIWRGISEVMSPAPEWDWSRLRRFADMRRFPRPKIAMLGEGYSFNPPQIRYAWPDLRGEVPVESLYEWTQNKPFDVHAAVERSAIAQLVITAPGFRGEATDGQVPNNRYNEAFAAALARDARFEGPYVIDVGTREPARIAVFVRR